MLTIGQLAGYVGVTTKTIRVYHDKGLLTEPERDASGYRRYGAQHVSDLIKIRTIAEAGVPLARIREIQGASRAQAQQALHLIDQDLTAHIKRLRTTQRRLRHLATGGHLYPLPDEVSSHLDGLSGLGFSARWVALETDLWILVFATRPDVALGLFHDQVQAVADPVLRQIYLDYDRAHDLDPCDPRIEDLARRMVTATKDRYGTGGLPGQDSESDIPALVQSSVNASSPSWRRLDALVRARLRT